MDLVLKIWKTRTVEKTVFQICNLGFGLKIKCSVPDEWFFGQVLRLGNIGLGRLNVKSSSDCRKDIVID